MFIAKLVSFLLTIKISVLYYGEWKIKAFALKNSNVFYRSNQDQGGKANSNQDLIEEMQELRRELNQKDDDLKVRAADQQ